MRYLYASADNYEDFASGRVLRHHPGLTNFPVRLAQEIFMRAVSYRPASPPVCLYDCCCGGGYLLTVLGLLNQTKIHRIIGRDISQQAIETAQKNLALLTVDGLARRRQEIERMLVEFGRPSYHLARTSLNHLSGRLTCPEIKTDLARGDIFSPQKLPWMPDLVITDLPYGQMTGWQTDRSPLPGQPDRNELSASVLLKSLRRQISEQTVVALSMDRKEKVQLDGYHRLEQQTIGHRTFVICQLVEQQNK